MILIEKQLLTNIEFSYIGKGRADHKQWITVDWRKRVRSYRLYQGGAGKYSHLPPPLLPAHKFLGRSKFAFLAETQGPA